MLDYHKIKIMSLFNTQYPDEDVYLIAGRSESKKGVKPLGAKGSWKQVRLGSKRKPDECLAALSDLFDEGYDYFILSRLLPHRPTSGINMFQDDMLKTLHDGRSQFYSESYIHIVDIDYKTNLKKLNPFVRPGKNPKMVTVYEPEMKLTNTDYPFMKTVSALKQFIKRPDGLGFKDGQHGISRLTTLTSSSTLKYVEGEEFHGSLSAHTYIITDSARRPEDVQAGFALKVAPMQTYAGLNKSGLATEPVHPYIDKLNAKPSQKVFEMTHFGNPTVHIQKGNKTLPDSYPKAMKSNNFLKPFEGEPIKCYTDEDKRKAVERAERADLKKLEYNKSLGIPTAIHKAVKGEDWPREGILTRFGGVVMIGGKPLTLGQLADGLVPPFSNFSGLANVTEELTLGGESVTRLIDRDNNRLYWASSIGIMQDRSSTTVYHSIALPSIPSQKLTDGYIGDKLVELVEARNDKLTLVLSDTGTGKTRGVMRFPVKLGGKYSEAHMTEWTHAILDDLPMHSLVSGNKTPEGEKSINSTDQDILGFAYNGMTVNKWVSLNNITHKIETVDGERVVTWSADGWHPNCILVIDEVHNMFSSLSPGFTKRALYAVLKGDLDLGYEKIVCLSATLDWAIMAHLKPRVIQFEHTKAKTMIIQKHTPWEELLGALGNPGRILIYLNERSGSAAYAYFFKRLGHSVIIAHGGNHIDEAGRVRTLIPKDITDYKVCIITSAMKEGYSFDLETYFGLVYTEKAQANHAGANDDEQPASRARLEAGQYITKVGKYDFSEPETSKVSLTRYSNGIGSTPSVTQMKMNALMKFDPVMRDQFRLDKETQEVMIDELSWLCRGYHSKNVSENKSFELYKRAMAAFGTSLEDNFSNIDIEDLDYQERLELGEHAALWEEAKDVSAIKNELTNLTAADATHEKLDTWVDKNLRSGDPRRRVKALEIKSVTKEDIRDRSASHKGYEKADLLESFEVRLRVKSGLRSAFALDAKYSALGHIEMMVANIASASITGEMVKISILFSELKKFVNKVFAEPPPDIHVEDAKAFLSLFLRFDIFDKDKVQMKNKSARNYYVIVTGHGAFDLETIYAPINKEIDKPFMAPQLEA